MSTSRFGRASTDQERRAGAWPSFDRGGLGRYHVSCVRLTVRDRSFLLNALFGAGSWSGPSAHIARIDPKSAAKRSLLAGGRKRHKREHCEFSLNPHRPLPTRQNFVVRGAQAAYCERVSLLTDALNQRARPAPSCRPTVDPSAARPTSGSGISAGVPFRDSLPGQYGSLMFGCPCDQFAQCRLPSSSVRSSSAHAELVTPRSARPDAATSNRSRPATC
jgi:hypothetical protein